MVYFLRFLVWFFGWGAGPFRRRRRAGMPIECLVVGYGGANNTGAEGRTAEAIKQILSADPRIVVTLTSLDRCQTLRYLNEHERLSVVEINPVFIISILKLVLRSDLVVLMEGSCFKENFSPVLLWFLMYAAALAQAFGLPTVTYGVDAGALSSSNRRWARDVADKMDLLMVRTNIAAQALRAIGVRRDIVVTTDTGFTLEPEGRHWAETVLIGQGFDLKRPIVGIAFEEFFWWPVVPSIWKAVLNIREDRYKSIYYHSWGRDGRQRSRHMKREIASYADWVAREFGAQIILFAMERLDIGPCRDVQGLMKARSVLIDADHANARQMAALLRRLDWLVTCRYHALVFAMGGGVPTIGLAHDERIASILDELGFIHDAFISFEEEIIFDLLMQKTEWLRGNFSAVHRRIEAAMPTYLARNARNGECFSQLIKTKFTES